MKIVSGCVVVKDNKILMVKEAKEKCYGKWNIPAGYVEELEKVVDAAVREVKEETGYEVKPTGVLPIIFACGRDGETRIMVRFTADIIKESDDFDTEEILDVKWIELNEVKSMQEKDLRAPDINIKFVKYFEENKIYPLELLDNAYYKA